MSLSFCVRISVIAGAYVLLTFFSGLVEEQQLVKGVIHWLGFVFLTVALNTTYVSDSVVSCSLYSHMCACVACVSVLLVCLCCLCACVACVSVLLVCLTQLLL